MSDSNEERERLLARELIDRLSAIEMGLAPPALHELWDRYDAARKKVDEQSSLASRSNSTASLQDAVHRVPSCARGHEYGQDAIGLLCRLGECNESFLVSSSASRSLRRIEWRCKCQKPA